MCLAICLSLPAALKPCGSLTSHDESKTLHLLKWRSSCYSNLSASCPLQILIVLDVLAGELPRARQCLHEQRL